MTKTKLFFYSLFCSVAELAYVLVVAYLMINSEGIFGRVTGFVGVAAFLLLFVFSALITGLLILGGPIYLYLEKQTKPALTWLLYNFVWLLVITIIILLILV